MCSLEDSLICLKSHAGEGYKNTCTYINLINNKKSKQPLWSLIVLGCVTLTPDKYEIKRMSSTGVAVSHSGP